VHDNARLLIAPDLQLQVRCFHMTMQRRPVVISPVHGYGVLLRIQQISGEQLQIQQGSLYPALYRLEHQGLISSEWGESENKRKAKFYRLTVSGRRQLHSETEKWNSMTALIASILHTTSEEI